MKTFQFEIVAHAIVAVDCETEAEAWEKLDRLYSVDRMDLCELLVSESEVTLIEETEDAEV
jgi:hypothetical protein